MSKPTSGNGARDGLKDAIRLRETAFGLTGCTVTNEYEDSDGHIWCSTRKYDAEGYLESHSVICIDLAMRVYADTNART